MAVNWIKVRGTLSSDTHVLEMGDFLKGCPDFAEYMTGTGTGHYSEEAAAKVLAFAMVEIWSHVMEQGERDLHDAILPLASVDRLYRLCGVPRMGEAVQHCGWVSVDTWNGRKCLRFPNLLKNNVLVKEQGQSVRERVAKHRAKQAGGDVTGGNSYTPLHVTPQRRGEEKRVDENTQGKDSVDAVASTPVVPRPEFSQRVEAIYDACTWRKEKPREAKKAIEKAGKRVAAQYLGDRDKAFEFLMARVLAYAKSPLVATTPKQFLPLPASWFNADKFDESDTIWNTPRQEQTNGKQPTRRADGTRASEYDEPELAANLPILTFPKRAAT